jgi:hypothetical protein
VSFKRGYAGNQVAFIKWSREVSFELRRESGSLGDERAIGMEGLGSRESDVTPPDDSEPFRRLGRGPTFEGSRAGTNGH